MNSNKFHANNKAKPVSMLSFYFPAEDTDNAEASTCGKILIFLSWVLVFLTMPISLLVCFKVSYINCDLFSYVNKDSRHLFFLFPSLKNNIRRLEKKVEKSYKKRDFSCEKLMNETKKCTTITSWCKGV
jgi:hypothetical protein